MSIETAPRPPVVTRRRLVSLGLKLGGAAAGIVVLTAAYGFFNPQPNGSSAVRFPKASCGDGTGRRYLVAYESEFGTTGEVGAAVAASLCANGAVADTRRMRDVTTLDGYDAVIIGAPIQFDTWMSEARDFVKDNEAALAEMPVAYFFTCLTLADPSPGNVAKAAGYARKIAGQCERVTPVDVGQFGGVLDYGRMSLPTVVASRAVYTLAGINEGDYRDWHAIAAWATNVHRSIA